MFCSECGMKILDNARFCFNCGSNIEDTLKKAEGKQYNLIKEDKKEFIINEEVNKIKENILEEKLIRKNKQKPLLCLEKSEEKRKSIFELDKELNEEKIQSNAKKTFDKIKFEARGVINEKLERKTIRMFSFDEEEFEERRIELSNHFGVSIKERILLIYDKSELKGKIEGIVITEKNIYMAGLLEKIDIVTIKEIKQVFHKAYTLRIGKIMLPIRSEENTSNFCECMITIIDRLKKI